jgi:hypothetical protein
MKKKKKKKKEVLKKMGVEKKWKHLKNIEILISMKCLMLN